VSPEQILERLKTELKLTPEQQASISRILKDAQTEIRAAYKAEGSEEAKVKAKELRLSNRLKIRSLLTEEQKKHYDQMSQRPETDQGPVSVFKVWTPVLRGKPVPVEITTGISDGSYTEIIAGALKEGQEVITDALGGNNKPAGTQTPPTMRGFR
jgi:HlyD family secretion protein